jgi:cell division protein FtsW (lipid II flippase)
MLKNKSTNISIPVMFWENSIGRSKNSDIILPDPSVSRDHAVLFRRKEGWIIADTGSKLGVSVNGKKITNPTQVYINDTITIGGSSLSIKKTDHKNEQKNSWFFDNRRHKKSINPGLLLLEVTFFHFLMAIEIYFYTKKNIFACFTPFLSIGIISWLFFIITIFLIKRVSYELESLGIFLSGIGIILIGGENINKALIQSIALGIGLFMFCFLIWFIEDLDRAMRCRVIIAIAALFLFFANLVIGKEINGSKNWIMLGPISIQPSEFIKIIFILYGTSTLDRLQTTKNLTGFIVFSAACIGCLFLMRDFGTACVFFVTFLIISFMRSGSIRTVILSCSAAAIGAFMILKFKPYIADRFAVWGHVWEYTQEGGYQQSRALSYSASGGLLGVGAGNGKLKHIFAGMSDLMFGTVSEELGLLIAFIIALAIAFTAFFSRAVSIHSRSTFYSISSCAAAGMLVFQCCLNIFGTTDIFPLTGVTLPFVSLGGSSMVSVWGLLAIIKSSDEYTYAAQKK